MILISQLQEYLQETQNQIDGINYNKVFIDDSQLTSILRNIKHTDNTLLIGLIPSHKPNGKNVDSIQITNYMLLMVLNKTDNRAGYEDFISNMAQSQEVTKTFIKQIIADATDDEEPCNIMKKIDVNSISIDPVWKLAGCDGYSIEMQLNTNLWD